MENRLTEIANLHLEVLAAKTDYYQNEYEKQEAIRRQKYDQASDFRTKTKAAQQRLQELEAVLRNKYDTLTVNAENAELLAAISLVLLEFENRDARLYAEMKDFLIQLEQQAYDAGQRHDHTAKDKLSEEVEQLKRVVGRR